MQNPFLRRHSCGELENAEERLLGREAGLQAYCGRLPFGVHEQKLFGILHTVAIDKTGERAALNGVYAEGYITAVGAYPVRNIGEL